MSQGMLQYVVQLISMCKWALLLLTEQPPPMATRSKSLLLGTLVEKASVLQGAAQFAWESGWAKAKNRLVGKGHSIVKVSSFSRALFNLLITVRPTSSPYSHALVQVPLSNSFCACNDIWHRFSPNSRSHQSAVWTQQRVWHDLRNPLVIMTDD
jgi:hypothetical protein